MSGATEEKTPKPIIADNEPVDQGNRGARATASSIAVMLFTYDAEIVVPTLFVCVIGV